MVTRRKFIQNAFASLAFAVLSPPPLASASSRIFQTNNNVDLNPEIVSRVQGEKNLVELARTGDFEDAWVCVETPGVKDAYWYNVGKNISRDSVQVGKDTLREINKKHKSPFSLTRYHIHPKKKSDKKVLDLKNVLPHPSKEQYVIVGLPAEGDYLAEFMAHEYERKSGIIWGKNKVVSYLGIAKNDISEELRNILRNIDPEERKPYLRKLWVEACSTGLKADSLSIAIDEFNKRGLKLEYYFM